jgi:S-adenosylmethionine/arginine decarboxylase-like enzyme
MDDKSKPKISHWIIEGFDVDPRLLDGTTKARRLMRRVLSGLGLTYLSSKDHYFGPGVTQIHILAESHSSIHTWPEDSYFYADIATCSKSLGREVIYESFREHFKTPNLRIHKVYDEH